MDAEKTIGILMQQRDKLASDFHNMQVEATIALQRVQELEAKLAEAEGHKCAACGNPCVCPTAAIDQ